MQPPIHPQLMEAIGLITQARKALNRDVSLPYRESLEDMINSAEFFLKKAKESMTYKSVDKGGS